MLSEPKYQAFRHDLLVASFHPGHRPQWTAHELCHALVGFAYRPGATSLFHALAAWLAELLPVTVWYFFDEADLRRCARHRGGGPLFRDYCRACEREALEGPRAPDREGQRRLREGKRYLDRELRAIARSRRLGRPQGTRFATIDLAEDALRYTAAHAPRLKAPAMERFVAQFFAPCQGHHPSLEALEARVLELAQAVAGDAAAPAWRATRWDYTAQDIGYRLLGLRERAGAETARGLDLIIDRLAARRSQPGVTAAIDAYAALLSAARGARRRPALPSSADLFAVGYALPRGLGRSAQQLGAGVASACPRTWRALGARRAAIAQAFAAADAPERAPLGRRFAAFLARELPGRLAELAALEAAVAHAPARDASELGLDAREARGAALELAPSAQIVRLEHDLLDAPRTRRARRPHALLVLRAADHGVDVLELPAALAAQIELGRARGFTRADFAAAPELLEQLLSLGALIPRAYAE